MREVALARQIREGPPGLALRADTKKPGASPGFGILVAIWNMNRINAISKRMSTTCHDSP
jgi:hypothetical protein